jgi:hypothetical protein
VVEAGAADDADTMGLGSLLRHAGVGLAGNLPEGNRQGGVFLALAGGNVRR